MLSSNQASQTDKETKLDSRPLGEKGANIKKKQRTQIKSVFWRKLLAQD